MDSLPQWHALSEGARTQLLQGVTAFLHGDTIGIAPQGDVQSWDELHRAGVVQPRSDTTAALILTGPGTCLILDALQASNAMEQLAR